MQIQVNTDHNIEGHEALAARIKGVVQNVLDKVSNHITRVEVHVTDENSDKKGGKNGMRCVMEARLERHQPVAVTHEAMTLDQAVDGAADKLNRLVENTLGRIHTQQGRRTDPPLPEEKLDEKS
jgi:ribosome-associated translation inhibitor RaiA